MPETHSEAATNDSANCCIPSHYLTHAQPCPIRGYPTDFHPQHSCADAYNHCLSA